MIAPTFIVSCPRSGSQMLFEALSLSPDLWTIAGESHSIFARFPELNPAAKRWESGRLDATDANAAIASRLALAWTDQLRDRTSRRLLDVPASDRPVPVPFLEKTPSNCLRVAFLAACFPDARFIFLHRDPRGTIASLIEAWIAGASSERFVTFRDVPGGPAFWCFFLPPEWQTVSRRPLPEIAAHQWTAANQQILDDLEQLPRRQWTAVSYENLVNDAGGEIARLCDFMNVALDREARDAIDRALPIASTALTPPCPDKWRRRERAVLDVLPLIDNVAQRLNTLMSVSVSARASAPG